MLRSVLVTFGAALTAAAAAACAQDPVAGQTAFVNQCQACHTIEAGAGHGIGPNLHGIIGQPAGSRDGARYSVAMRERGAAGLVWTEDHLRQYLTHPNRLVPRTSMMFPGISDPRQVDDLIAFLRQQTPGR